MDERIRELERKAAGGDPEAEAQLLRELVRVGDLTARYVSGEHARVWAELRGLGERIREPQHLADAQAVARETMRRVRKNVETLRARLERVGYRFQYPDEVHVPPPADAVARLDAIEEQLGGPFPLSLRAFYEVVGSVNFAQAHDQTIHDWLGPAPGELELLGDDDPLWVDPLDSLEAYLQEAGGPDSVEAYLEEEGARVSKVYFCFAPDPFHKANVSGGENFHAWLPNPHADFRIVGDVCAGPELPDAWTQGSEWFLLNLRATFAGGGFRGRPDFDARSRRRPRRMAKRLAEGLLPI